MEMLGDFVHARTVFSLTRKLYHCVQSPCTSVRYCTGCNFYNKSLLRDRRVADKNLHSLYPYTTAVGKWLHHYTM